MLSCVLLVAIHIMTAKPGLPMQEDMKHLLRDAAEGLPVAKRKVTWENERPTVKGVGDATKLRGFVEYGRQAMPYRPVEDRLQDYGEVLGRLPQQDQEELLHTQAARCMDCGTPFCHQTSSGQPLFHTEKKEKEKTRL